MKMLTNLQICGIIFTMSGLYGAIQNEDFILQSDSLPDDVRFRPPIGNGHIATNVLSDTVYMNGLFNGYEDRSSRARIPAYVSCDVNVTNLKGYKRTYTLDMRQGIFRQTIRTGTYVINVSYFAHRKFTRLMVTRFEIRSLGDGLQQDLRVGIVSNSGPNSTDFETLTETNLENVDNGRYYSGCISEPETNDTPARVLHIAYTDIPDVIYLPQGQQEVTYTFIASYGLDQAEAVGNLMMGIHDENLLQSHIEAMGRLWDEGHVYVKDNKDLMQNITAAMYNIMCSLPVLEDPINPFYGLGPGGLSRGGLLVPDKPGGPKNDYSGHVFWDMDTWIMPPVMLFHPAMARRMIGARIRVMDQARRNAKEAGYDGIKYPWEQASSGIEVTPKWAGQMALYQHHVTADVSYSLRQYLYANDDIDIIKRGRGFELALEIARFWRSRVVETDDHTVEILGVMGPDEYHYNVNNSVFTNYNAKLSLLLPEYIVEKFALEVNDSIHEEMGVFKSVADKMFILYDEKDRYHIQYEGFSFSSTIKQSDVVLLGYPLMMDMAPHVRRNDLELYEKVTNPQGPDTGTWSMHTVGWLELGEESRAETNFKMMLRNVNGPFKVFSEKPVTETATGGCVNFITGAGGFLQSVMFGYGGLRLHPDRLVINPHLLPAATSWGMQGLHYRGVRFDLDINEEAMAITVTHTPGNATVALEHPGGGDVTYLALESRTSLRRSVVSLKVVPETEASSAASLRGFVKLTFVVAFAKTLLGLV